jgi:hypothetical protein
MAESERLKLAKTISKIILQKYRNEFYLWEFTAPLQEGEDADYSDIDMYVVAKSLTSQKYISPIREYPLLYTSKPQRKF